MIEDELIMWFHNVSLDEKIQYEALATQARFSLNLKGGVWVKSKKVRHPCRHSSGKGFIELIDGYKYICVSFSIQFSSFIDGDSIT